MVSRSLRNLLLDGLSHLTPAVNVSILAPDESGTEPRVNLFLYKVKDSATHKNADWQVSRTDASRIVPPPLSLSLFYLMTPYAVSDQNTGNSNTHEIFGEAMRVFYENPVIPDDFLESGLASASERFEIMLLAPDLDELGTIWNTFSEPYRLSVLYEVSVVQLDMLSDKERDMARRVRSIGIPRVEAPFQPPIIETLEPKQGAADATITVQGKNFTGWRAFPSISLRNIAPVDLTGNTFQFDLPGSLQPGFHEIRISISRLHTRTFFYEVTA